MRGEDMLKGGYRTNPSGQIASQSGIGWSDPQTAVSEPDMNQSPTYPETGAGPLPASADTDSARQLRVRRQAGVFRRAPFVWLVALVTLGSGLVSLASLIGPSLPGRIHFLKEVFPLEFIHLSRFFTLLTGFALVVSSLNVYKRK